MLKKPGELDTNPIYQRLTRNSDWPDEKAERWLIVGVVSAGILIDMVVLLLGDPRLVEPVLWLLVTPILITPAVAALAAASLVTRDMQKEDFQMVRLTLATDRSLLHGYTFATLYRLRALLIVTRSMIPVLIVLGLVPEQFIFPVPIVRATISVLIGTLALVYIKHQVCEMGAALGVTLTLWWQQPILAVVGASTLMLMVAPLGLSIMGCVVMAIIFVIIG